MFDKWGLVRSQETFMDFNKKNALLVKCFTLTGGGMSERLAETAFQI